MINKIILYFQYKWFKHTHKNTKVITNFLGEITTGFYSQMGQDSIVYTEFFELFNKNTIPKVFVDIGCNHPTKFNNSYFFEKHLGFHCIGIDPLPSYISLWADLRPRAKFLNYALGSVEGFMDMKTVDASELADSDHPSDMYSTLTDNTSKLRSANWQTLKVPVRIPQKVFESEGLSEIGIISIDVEGFEMHVLNGIDFSKIRIHIAIIENNTNSILGLEEVRSLMKKNGFNFYARIWNMDDIYINNDISL